jgi:hypothetical protein
LQQKSENFVSSRLSSQYLILVLRSDYHGKGGIFALISVLFPIVHHPYLRETLVFLACFAFACMIGDGAMTPAISVVSAVGGVLIPAPQLGNAFVVPISMLILLLLLFYQVRRREDLMTLLTTAQPAMGNGIHRLQLFSHLVAVVHQPGRFRDCMDRSGG